MKPKVGIEIEIPAILPDSIEGILRDAGLNTYIRALTDDGSCRFATRTLDGVPISILHPNNERIAPAGHRKNRSFGLELVTNILSADEAYAFAKGAALVFGHLKPASMAGIHVHVNVRGKPWTFVQNLLKLAYQLEQVWYILSSDTNGRHRGESNNYKYARPLSNPICWSKTNDRPAAGENLAPVVDTQKLLSAKTASEMLAAWGRLDILSRSGNLPHYCPHRLMAFNLYSVVRQGSFEWRIWGSNYAKLPYMLDVIYKMFEQADDSAFVTDLMRRPASILGGDLYVSTAELYEWYGVAFERLAGYRLRGSSSGFRRLAAATPMVHHYGNYTVNASTWAETPNPVMAVNSRGNQDDGTNTWVIYY